MNKFLTRQSINLDINTKCTLACSKCWRDVHLSDGKQPLGKDMSVDEFKKISLYFKNITFCGQISDPILHSKFHEFLKISYENNNTIEIRTAVSHRPMSWFEKAFASNLNATWIFAIDGLPKDSHKYRVRQDGEKLFKAMLLAKKMGIEAVWSFIIMSYNENNINTAMAIAKENGIRFHLVKSSRWFKDDPLKPLNPENYIESTWRSHLNV
jgi:MoaA/NifB/PqqE/SkfB family radical SAM enzyme